MSSRGGPFARTACQHSSQVMKPFSLATQSSRLVVLIVSGLEPQWTSTVRPDNCCLWKWRRDEVEPSPKNAKRRKSGPCPTASPSLLSQIWLAYPSGELFFAPHSDCLTFSRVKKNFGASFLKLSRCEQKKAAT